MEIEAGNLGDNIQLICTDENCSVFQMKEESGEGLMTMYTLFPGCYIAYNDYHMSCCHSGFQPKTDLFCIDHCREGRIEWERSPGRYVYVSSGDIQVDCRQAHAKDFFFPLNHYHGLGIYVDLNYTDNGVLHMMDDFSVDLKQLAQKLCLKNSCFIMRSGQQIDRIFSELYDLPEHVRKPYCKIKIMELLMFLQNLDVPAGGEERPYFYKTQVDKIKSMVELQVSDLTKWYTQEELSKSFAFPITGMKRCFKGIYGCTMAEYMKNYRMNAAAEMIRTTKLPIIEIAAAVGYENPGKFSGVFRACKGVTPTQYRKPAD